MSDLGAAGPSATTRLRDEDESQRSDGQGDEGNPHPVKKSKRLGTKHVSQACDACKAKCEILYTERKYTVLILRKVKCDGARPSCVTCSKKKQECTYGKNDGRKYVVCA